MIQLDFDTSFVENLPQDSILENYPRQVHGAVYSLVEPQKTKNAQLLHSNPILLHELGWQGEEQKEWFSQIFSGNDIMPNTQPYAMCYGGHQFGQWAGQLGDGRAINLFTIQQHNKVYTFQLKGAGPTPYSRTADGFAVLRSSIREHLCSEAMFHLGVPTTRSLSLCLTGEQVLRDVMYDGNPAYEPGAVVCRVAPSFLRFGNFEIFAARRDKENLQQLVSYTLNTHFPFIQEKGDAAVVEMFRQVAHSTIDMVFEWERVGFVHGVMNTDNMSILGLTIDYGPYGWLENYDPNWTPNTTDRQGRRYRFGLQANIAIWNLVQLANALNYLVDDPKQFEEILQNIYHKLPERKSKLILTKLGLYDFNQEDIEFTDELLSLLEKGEFDYTIFFRELSMNELSAFHLIQKASYLDQDYPDSLKHKLTDWLVRYQERIKEENVTDRLAQMKKVNPKYIIRNYMAQLAIEQAEKGECQLLYDLFSLLQKPYEEQKDFQKWYTKRPDWAKHKIGSSMLSCSS